MPEPGFVWMRVGFTNGGLESKRQLVFTCPICNHVNVDPETIPPRTENALKPRLGWCQQCQAWVRTPTDAAT